MKELTIEQKAKLYDEAVEKLQKALTPTEDGCKISGLTRGCIENIFPELKEVESKDERIRKGLLKMFNHYVRNNIELNEYDLDKDMVLAWLEKQGEKNTAKPKFHEGDWIAHNVANFVFQIVGVGTYGYNVVNREGYAKTISLSNEENYHLWNIKDAKDGDVLACNEEILLFESYSSVQGRFSLYCWYNGHTNKFHNKEVVDSVTSTRNRICPATKEQRDTLMKAMTDAGWGFDFEKKEMNKIEQAPTWSEEDEHRAKDTIYFLDTAKKHYASTVELDACIDWVKSLKPQDI